MSDSGTKDTVLSIRGHEIRYEYRLMDINEIGFYKSNPRIASIISAQGGSIDDDVIDRILWDRDKTHRLKRDIESDGGLIHPILVYKSEVLEGNTRLCCYRHLFLETGDQKWKQIKSHVILDELDKIDIYRLLCTEHIEGKIEWDAYEKANLYCKMKKEEGMTLEQITATVGESTSTVGYRIKAYELMVENLVTDKSKYSHFEQLVRNRGIQQISERDPDVQRKVVEMILSERIGDAQNVRKIEDIYKHKEARKRLFGGNESVDQVYHDLKAIAPMTDSAFMKDVEALVERIQRLQRGEREELQQSSRDCRKIQQLAKELVSLCKELGLQIHIPKKLTTQSACDDNDS